MPERRGPRRAARARSPGSSGRRGSNTRTRASRTSKIPPERKPGRDRIERLASCQWVRDRETLIIIPRHGKREKPRSARPSATPHAAGESPHDTRACRTCPGEIDRARLDGQAAYYRKVDEFKSIDLPVLDDFPATPADAADSILISRDHGGTQLGRRHARRQPMRTRAMVREVRQRAHRRQYPESSHRLRPVSRTRRPRHAPTQHHTQRRKRMEGSDRRHQRITLSTKRTAGTIHRLPAVPLIGDPITKNDLFPRQISESPMMSESRMRVVPGVLRKTPGTTIQSLSSNNTNVPRCNQRRTVIYLKQ